MATKSKPGADPVSDAEPLAPEEQPQPFTMPTEGDEVRGVGRRAFDDLRSGKKDTDQAGRDQQRDEAPADSPTKRSGVVDGSDS
jgi:hypothetical protein